MLATFGHVICFIMLFSLSLAGTFSLRWYHYFFPAIELISFVGFWKLTSPDPADTRTPAQLDAKKLTRALLFIGLCLTSLGIVRAELGPTIENVLSVCMHANDIASPIALFTFAKQLAMRVPNKKLATSCQRLMYLTIADAVLNATVWAFVLASLSAVSFGFIRALSFINMIPMIVALFWSVVVLDKFRRSFSDAARFFQDAQTQQPMAMGGGMP